MTPSPSWRFKPWVRIPEFSQNQDQLLKREMVSTDSQAMRYPEIWHRGYQHFEWQSSVAWLWQKKVRRRGGSGRDQDTGGIVSTPARFRVPAIWSIGSMDFDISSESYFFPASIKLLIWVTETSLFCKDNKEVASGQDSFSHTRFRTAKRA